jgi:hypothetical protein
LPRRFSIVRYYNGLPSWYASMRSSSWESGVANSMEFSTRAGVGVDVPGGVAVVVGVHGGTDCGGGDEGLVAAEVVARDRGAEVGRGSETGVDILGGRELVPLAAARRGRGLPLLPVTLAGLPLFLSEM